MWIPSVFGLFAGADILILLHFYVLELNQSNVEELAIQ